ncbi:hypothetical protein [Polyangium sp. 15x6]|uniref:hypothetical protein n=1 Tax=Polyangium sp. 15x6 TaxID=3042687 RepID=UPI00249B81F4|nr:hypothetical protein [Polyangium sp. 15x6]MDI3291535.1 hypothetical protein [Polyangium sp. 15x6]
MSRSPSHTTRAAPSALPMLLGAAALALAGCGLAPPRATQAPTPPPFAPRWEDPPSRQLELGQPAQGDTRSPDLRITGWRACKHAGYWALDHVYGFEVGETASYRFTLSPQFHGVVQVLEKHPSEPRYFLIGCERAGRGARAEVALPLGPGLYWVVVDGYQRGEAGPYELRVERDTSATAKLRPEDEDQVSALCERAPLLTAGERAHGRFESTPGGARASCGLVGSEVVYRLSLASPRRMRVRASAHFRPVLEIRSGCHAAATTCARAPAGEHDVEIVQELGAGDHFVVLDGMQIEPRSGVDFEPKAYERPLLQGAYIIDTEEVPR